MYKFHFLRQLYRTSGSYIDGTIDVVVYADTEPAARLKAGAIAKVPNDGFSWRYALQSIEEILDGLVEPHQ